MNSAASLAQKAKEHHHYLILQYFFYRRLVKPLLFVTSSTEQEWQGTARVQPCLPSPSLPLQR